VLAAGTLAHVPLALDADRTVTSLRASGVMIEWAIVIKQ
jgi:hypothetical protein